MTRAGGAASVHPRGTSFLHPDKITDEQAFALARSLSRKIEAGLQYPGQIRVTVVRETRCIEFAK